MVRCSPALQILSNATTVIIIAVNAGVFYSDLVMPVPYKWWSNVKIHPNQTMPTQRRMSVA